MTADAPRRCRFDATGNTGTILHEVDHLSAYDGDLGPWFFVGFDDGYRAWVVQDDVTVFAGDSWPIEPSAGTPPAAEKQDVLATLDHVAALLSGAANAPTVDAWYAIADAKERVDALRRRTLTESETRQED